MKIGIIDSYYTEATVLILKKLLMNIDLIPIIISTGNYNGDTVDILVVNRKPVFSEQPSFSCESAVINTDDKSIVKYLMKSNTKIITYGFNSRASVTASSILDDKVVFCVQRSFETLKGSVVHEQEFTVLTRQWRFIFGEAKTGIEITANIQYNIEYSQFVINCLLPAVTAALAAGAFIDDGVINLSFLLEKV